MQTKKLAILALYATLSLAIYAAESMLPPLAPIPGFQLGLANVITLILLLRYTPGEAALVLIVRIILSALLFGQAISLLYSLTGGILSLLVMGFSNKSLHGKFPQLTGAMGGLSHNIGQILTAYFITATSGVLAYLPFLLPAGIITGLFTGSCALFADKRIPKQ